MAFRRIAPSIAAVLLLAAAAPGGVLADPLDDAALDTRPQYYLMALPPSPVGEIAEAVLGEALGLPYKVDPDVTAQMAFQLDGPYAPKALAQEFGHRLWNVDVALIEKPSDGLWLIPRGELDAALAQGATLVAPVASMKAPPPRPQASSAAPRTPASPRDRDWAWLAWLLTGWTAGAASILAWLRLRVRSLKGAAARPAPALPAPEVETADELVIPVFPQSARNNR